MTFNSLEYIVFLPCIWVIYSILGQRYHWFFLLFASLVFYLSLEVPYLLGVLAVVALASYGFGLLIGRTSVPRTRKHFLWGGIITNILILVVLKYLPFINENLNTFLSVFDVSLESSRVPVFVAIGVSYYIFQAISYLVDVYLEIEEPEPHLGYFALYLAFFPKLLQGPIERAGSLLPQLKQRYEFNYNNMRFGLLLFGWGLFKKVVLADRLGIYVDTVYDDVQSYQGLPLLLATYGYAFQIYFDFSGYTDMALGTAKMFNINLTQNFNSPYLAISVADFWRRWHITFSRWILDYIFKPLQMQWRNWQNWGTAAALLVTFLVSGIWHGASYGFVIWGLLHGLYMASSVFYRPYQKKIHKALKLEKSKILKAWQIFVTFNLVSIAWVFFRGNNLGDCFYVFENMFNSFNLANIFVPRFGRFEMMVQIAAMLLIIIVSALKSMDKTIDNFWKTPMIFRWSVYYGLLIAVSFLGIEKHSEFMYFKF